MHEYCSIFHDVHGVLTNGRDEVPVAGCGPTDVSSVLRLSADDIAL